MVALIVGAAIVSVFGFACLLVYSLCVASGRANRNLEEILKGGHGS